MKKIYYIIGGILLVIIGVLLFILLGNNKKGTVDIKLMTNGGVPYKWEYTIEDPSIVKVKKEYSKDLDPNMDGGRVENHFVFAAKKEGKTKVTFKYKSIKGDDFTSEEKYILVVDKDKNIRIENGFN